MIYGITGLKGHGKDTLARTIQLYDKTIHIIPFAGELKRMCGEIFGLNYAQLHSPDVKEAPLAAPVQMDAHLDKMRELTGLNIQPRGCVAGTPREILQYFGTEYVRSIQDNYWIERAMKQAAELGGTVLIPDTRFLNEAAAIKGAGGRLIRVVRMGASSTTVGASHASETEMAQIQPDYTLEVPEGKLTVLRQFAREFTGTVPEYANARKSTRRTRRKMASKSRRENRRSA